MADIKTYQVNLGAHIKDVRHSRHITQEALAEIIGISRVYMGFIEQGRSLPSHRKLIDMSEALGVSVPQLVDIEWVPNECDVEYLSDEGHPVYH